MVVDGASSEPLGLVQTEIRSAFLLLLHDSATAGFVTMSENLTEFLAAFNQKFMFFLKIVSQSPNCELQFSVCTKIQCLSKVC